MYVSIDNKFCKTSMKTMILLKLKGIIFVKIAVYCDSVNCIVNTNILLIKVCL